jgi:hypothetical protein
MKMGQVSKSCFAVLNQKNRMYEVNSHLINPGGGVVIDTQLQQDYDFNDIKLALPTTLFDERHELNLDGTEVDLIYVGPCHRVGDTIVHVPAERVLDDGCQDRPWRWILAFKSLSRGVHSPSVQRL